MAGKIYLFALLEEIIKKLREEREARTGKYIMETPSLRD